MIIEWIIIGTIILLVILIRKGIINYYERKRFEESQKSIVQLIEAMILFADSEYNQFSEDFIKEVRQIIK